MAIDSVRHSVEQNPEFKHNFPGVLASQFYSSDELHHYSCS